jgi:hypothetical protein
MPVQAVDATPSSPIFSPEIGRGDFHDPKFEKAMKCVTKSLFANGRVLLFKELVVVFERNSLPGAK